MTSLTNISMKTLSYNATVYTPERVANFTVSAPSANEAARNLWLAVHGVMMGFNVTRRNTPDDNAHAQWLGGHAGIIIKRLDAQRT